MRYKEILNEQRFQFTVDGYGYNEEENIPIGEEDPIKKWHYMTTPTGERIILDHSPYEWMEKEDFAEYVAKHKASLREASTNSLSTVNRFVIRHASGSYVSNFSFGDNSKITNAKIFLALDAAKLHLGELAEGWRIVPVEVTIREIE